MTDSGFEVLMVVSTRVDAAPDETAADVAERLRGNETELVADPSQLEVVDVHVVDEKP